MCIKGCYWHIQHEFVEAERKLLNRSDTELTSRTGYAGGTATDAQGRVSKTKKRKKIVSSIIYIKDEIYFIYYTSSNHVYCTSCIHLSSHAFQNKNKKCFKVCYHNLMSVADYGKLGHGEVVGMKIPQSSIGDFANEYFNLFTAKGERVDPMDRGGEYRSLLGLPNGMNNPAYPAVEAAAKEKGMILVSGKGNDPDTLGTKKVFVYDTGKI